MTAPPLPDKIAWLSRPDCYAEVTSAVEMIETHISYVFLTDRLVYKMKKPVRYPFLDFTTLDARRFNCEEEVRLNRRLARHVYLGAVPLTLTGVGLELEGSGTPVEWLVKMLRLPRHLMLDCAIREGRVAESDAKRFARVLVPFYQRAERVPLTTSAYRGRLRRRALEQHAALVAGSYGLDAAQLESLRDAQLAFLSARAAVFDARVERGLIVEGHGDLRPEHVCLAAEPVFIDCLEFSRELRIIDPIEELAYLAMECEILGARHVGEIALDTYGEITGDAPGGALVRFYELQVRCSGPISRSGISKTSSVRTGARNGSGVRMPISRWRSACARCSRCEKGRLHARRASAR